MSVTLNDPTKDGYIYPTYANVSTAAYFEIGNDGGIVCRSYIEWDITTIPDTAVITKAEFRYDCDTHGIDCHIHAMAYQPSVATDANLYGDMADGTVYADVAGFPVAGQTKSIDLGATACSDIQAALGNNWFAIGLQSDNEATGAYAVIMSENGTPTPKPTLYVEYDIPTTTSTSTSTSTTSTSTSTSTSTTSTSTSTSTSTTSTSTSTSTSTTSTTSTSTSTTTTFPPCTRMICLDIDGFNVTTTDWTEVGDLPYLNTYAYTDLIKTNVNANIEDEFTFEDTVIPNILSVVELDLWGFEELAGDDVVEIYMWESVGGWEKVGEFDPTSTTLGNKYTFDITQKFNTTAKINEAKLRLKYKEV